MHDNFLPKENEIVKKAIKALTLDSEKHFPTIFEEIDKMKKMKEEIVKYVNTVIDGTLAQKLPDI